MKKSTRKVVNYLKQYIGLEIIRTKPTSGRTWTVDWSHSDEPIILLGFTSDGCIRYRHSGFNKTVFGNKEYILPFDFTDRNWVTYKKALRAKHNVLNKWRGKEIKRLRPTATCGDRYYMCEYSFEKAPTLVSASKYHMVIEHHDIGLEGSKTILRADYIKPEDWALA